MAIISAEELLASREAIAAGVSDADPASAETAIAVAQAAMNRALGYKPENDATALTVLSGEGSSFILSERVRSITSVTEATQGGSPSTVSDHYEIRGDGFSLFRTGGWRENYSIVIYGAFGFAATDDRYILAKQFVTIAAVRYLEKTKSSNPMPTPAGAVLTGWASEKAQFSYFTPTPGEGSTGYQDLDTLLDQIGRHPNKKPGLFTIGLTSGRRDITFDDIVAGRERVEDSW